MKRAKPMDRRVVQEKDCDVVFDRVPMIRAGWNDAAWARPRRALAGPSAHFYEVGYQGGLIFRGRAARSG